MAAFRYHLGNFYIVGEKDFSTTNNNSSGGNSNNNFKKIQCLSMTGTSKDVFKVKCTGAVVCLLSVVELALSAAA